MSEPVIKTNIDWDVVKAEMESQEWADQSDYGAEGQQRSVFLGTVFSLYPSGKFYTPWANSNLDLCEKCLGAGNFPAHRRRRIAKKWRTKGNPQRFHRRATVEGLTGDVPRLLRRAWYRSYRRHVFKAMGPACPWCGGCGSREAYLDELFREKLEAEADERGYGVESGEGDPCDIFVFEYRDKSHPRDND